MSVLVVGSVAYDSVRTPAGSRDDALGGSATFFSVSASYFTPVSIVAVVGDDFREADVKLLESHNVDISGLERRTGKTFRWSGVYGAEDLNTRETLDTQLNVFADFAPVLSPEHRRQPFLFLANIAPDLQLDVLDQMKNRPRLVALDTMNFWIEGSKESLWKVVEAVDLLFMDDGEVRSFAGEPNLVRAVERIIDNGPSAVMVKRGEHGALLFKDGMVFLAPAFPLKRVVDPTGAGDSFAGGFMGYLAANGDLSTDGFRRAAVVGSVMGSFAVESFSLERLSTLTPDEIEGRFRALTTLTRFTPLGENESLPWRDRS
jgi:sugar/nucleoside kinase (ribokinase family)